MNILLTLRKWHEKSDFDNPIGLLDLGAFLRKQGHDVDLYYIDDIPQGNRYDLVGVSVFTDDFGKKAVWNDLYGLKERFGNSKIVVGGRYTHYLNRSEIKELEKDGFEIWVGDGELYFSKQDEIDYPVYPSWQRKDLETLNTNGNAVMSSRGCPYDCSFCHNIQKKVSFFHPMRTVDNIQLLFERKVDHVFIIDDIFTIRKKHMLDVLHGCNRRGVEIKGKNKFFTHINLINEDIASVMQRFDPFEVQVGIESGDSEMLKRMNKPFSPEKALGRIEVLSRFVPINGLFLIGFPGESIQSLENTLRFVKKAKKYLRKKWVSLYQPVPKTKGYELAVQNGSIIGKRQDNTEVTYIDRNLSRETLLEFRDTIMNA
jgi:radical SAM superfamily enzyme YgiQ (UPF0313 family)